MSESDFLSIVKERGFVHQCTDEAALAAKLREGPLPAYIGYDCTAPSLHVGSLLSIMLLRWWQKCGNKPIVLMGGGTTKVGDPSGKDETRQLLSNEKISSNKKSLGRVFEKFLAFGEGADGAVMVDNAEWLDKLSYIPFLRDVGRHFSVNAMLTRDSVKTRLEREQNFSFLEFNYMILQAYDFLELSRKHNCSLQMGGSDQWGNIVSGVELIRRIDKREAFGLTTPLLTMSSGAKMGKTAEGAVWLNAEICAPYDYWQFWRNTEDADVGRFLRLFTELPMDEIKRLESLGGAEINEAKKILADEATKMIHGENKTARAVSTAQKIFEEGGLSINLKTVKIAAQDLERGVMAFDLLTFTELSETTSKARKLIRGGGARLNDVKIEDESLTVTKADIGPEGVIKLSSGKKNHVLVKPDAAGSRVISQMPSSPQKQKETGAVFAGVDGCPGGWIIVTEGKNGIEARVIRKFKEVLIELGPDAVVAVDIPIGLLTQAKKGGRDCENLARSRLKPHRYRSIFSSPVRAALKHLDDYNTASEANAQSSDAGLRLSKQSFSIMPKIKEVDDIMTPDKQKRVFEGHPELSFMKIAGGNPMLHKKASPEGQRDRLALLKKNGLGGIESWLNKFLRKQAAPDDILDAAALLWSARRIAGGNAVRIPEQRVYDKKNLDMAMWY